MSEDDEAKHNDSDSLGITQEDLERIRKFLQTPVHERNIDDLSDSADE